MDLATAIATAKKLASYLGAAAGLITAAVFFAQGDVGNGVTALTAALAAFGVNLPAHAQVNAATPTAIPPVK
jgi:hypothetical protein